MIYIFCIGISALIWSTFILSWSLQMPHKRLWPITKPTPLKLAIIWIPYGLIIMTILLIGILDWNHFAGPQYPRYLIGGAFIGAGYYIGIKCLKKLTVKASSGQPHQLTTTGLYRYSRNPQYIAIFLRLIGWVILCASLWLLPIILGTFILFILTVFVEEPWLRDIYGHKYEEYCIKTPRFF